MENEFLPYNLALRMKALGFDEPCLAIWKDGKLISVGGYWGSSISHSMFGFQGDSFLLNEFRAPLYQQAFKWFREKYNLHSFTDCKWKNLGWEFELVDLDKMEPITSVGKYGFENQEAAQQAALEKLCEIVENK